MLVRQTPLQREDIFGCLLTHQTYTASQYHTFAKAVFRADNALS